VASIRQRFLLATGLLLGLQVASTVFALGSWRGVLDAANREQELADWRVEVVGLGSAIREQYVHQAHTYIEGGPGHLDHHRGTAGDAEQRLDRIAQLPLEAADRAAVEAIAADLVAMNGFFEEKVAPEARAGTLDRARAAELHATTEATAARLTGRVEELLTSLDASAAEVRGSARAATTRAWWATAAFTLGGLLLVFAFDRVARRYGQEQERRVRAERLAALGEMSAAVAHELMNPLTVLLGHLKMAPDPALAPLRDEAEHARRVVQGLLGFARPTEEPAGAVDLGKAVRDAADRALPFAEGKDIGVKAVVSAEATVQASPSAVRQVLDNLVKNAVDASPPGAEVEVRLDAGPVIRVLDRGPGIPRAVRERLYEPFVTGKAHGTGLGLAVCQRIVRAQGGSLVHQDRAGGGTEAVWTP
jgi:signal transduction histidine kinase